MTSQQSPIEARIGRLREIQALIAKIRDAAEELPVPYHDDVAAELRAVADEFSEAPSQDTERLRVNHQRTPKALGRHAKVAAHNGTPAGSDGNIRQRMKHWFLANSNEPVIIPDIAEKIGADPVSVATLLYRRNKGGEFEKAGKLATGHAPSTLWRLSKEEFERLATEKPKS